MDRTEAILTQGRRAKAVLDDETVMEAFAHITEQLQKQWRATAMPMAEHRESLFHQIAGLDAVKAQLKQWVEAANFEAAKLEKANARHQRRRP